MWKFLDHFKIDRTWSRQHRWPPRIYCIAAIYSLRNGVSDNGCERTRRHVDTRDVVKSPAEHASSLISRSSPIVWSSCVAVSDRELLLKLIDANYCRVLFIVVIFLILQKEYSRDRPSRANWLHKNRTLSRDDRVRYFYTRTSNFKKMFTCETFIFDNYEPELTLRSSFSVLQFT